MVGFQSHKYDMLGTKKYALQKCCYLRQLGISVCLTYTETV